MLEPLDKQLAVLSSVLTAILSWIVLAAISIIISGKLIAFRLPIGIRDEAHFEIPLVIFKIRARGEEVTIGLLVFIISLSGFIFFGGKEAYNLFKDRSGIDIGQWSSLCVMASFLSLIVAALICVIVPFIRGTPVLSEEARNETLRLLQGMDSHE